MNLETMQREGREKIDSYANTWGWHHKVCIGNQHFPSCPVIHLEKDLDQHTANVWKAALNSLLESGLLEEKDISPFKNDPFHPVGLNYTGQNTLARAVKEFISNMDKV